MSSCDVKKLIKAANDSLEILKIKGKSSDINRKEYEEARQKPLDKIIECHQKKMEYIINNIDTHTADNTELHNFEKNIAIQLVEENKLRYNNNELKQKEDIFSKLLEVKYNIDTKIKDYEKKTNKIKENMNSNNFLLESQTTKTNLLKNINIGVLTFVIIGLIYINFKNFFSRKPKILLKKKENELFNLNDGKKINQTFNNNNKL